MVSNSFARSAWTPEEGWQNPPGTFHPAELGKSLSALRVHLTEISQHEILPFIPKAAEIDQSRDRKLETFCHQLAQCVSVQAAGNWLMEHQPWDFTASYYECGYFRQGVC